MPESVWQVIRDMVLAPALLSCSLQALLAAALVMQLLTCGSQRTWVCRSESSRVPALFVLGGWVFSIAVVVAGASVAVRFDERAFFAAVWPVTALLWMGVVAGVRGRLWFTFASGLALGLAGWLIDAYVTPLVLFAE